MNKMLTQVEVMHELGVSREHLAHLRDAGLLKFIDVRMDNASRPSWRITAASLKKFIKQRTAKRGGVA